MRDIYTCRTESIKRGGKVKKHFHLFIDSFWLYRFTTAEGVTFQQGGKKLSSCQEFLHLATSSETVKSFCIWQSARQLSRVFASGMQLSSCQEFHHSVRHLSRCRRVSASVKHLCSCQEFQLWQVSLSSCQTF
jgi:hypothetical protein